MPTATLDTGNPRLLCSGLYVPSKRSAERLADARNRRPCAGLVLEAPFTSAADVAATVLPVVGPLLVRSYNSLPKIRWIRVPKLFLQGDRDEIIPLRLGQELFAAAQAPKSFWVIAGAGHNDIVETAGPEYREKLRSFYEGLLRPRSAK